MAEVSQYGPSARSELGAEDVSNQAASGTVLQTLLDSEEILQIDARQSHDTNRERPTLPGVQHERRFHRFYPEILVNNSLLRQLLREDYRSQRRHDTEDDTQCSDQIVLGHALGDQSRLHDILVAVSSVQPNVLHFVLLQSESLELTRGEAQIPGRTYGPRAGTQGRHVFSHGILEIMAPTGKAAPIFLLRTEQGVQCVGLSFNGGLKNPIVETRILFEISLDDLVGHKPLACMCICDRDWRIYVVTTDGHLRIWQTGARPSLHTCKFNLSFTTRLRFGSRLIGIWGLDSNEGNILIIDHITICRTNIITESCKTLYQIGEDERILEVKYMDKQSNSRGQVLCILTSTRLVVALVDFESFRLIKDLKHSLGEPKQISLQAITTPTTVSIVLQVARSDLCIIYSIDSQLKATTDVSISRLRLQHVGDCSGMLIFPVFFKSAKETTVLCGLICFSKHSKVVSTILGSTNEVVTRKNKAAKVRGPALIASDDEAEVSSASERTAEQSTLDLSRFYADVFESMSTLAPSPTSEDLVSCQHPMNLGSDILSSRMRLASHFDEFVENNMSRYQTAERQVIETPGLVLCPALYGSEPDTTTAAQIDLKLHHWRGKNQFLATAAAASEQSQYVAQSLALAAISVTSLTELSELLDHVQVNGKRQNSRPSQALKSIMDDWAIDESPRDYQWCGIDGETGKEHSKQFTVPDIPAFRAPVLPTVASSQARPSSPRPEDDFLFTSTQPVQGKFGERKVKKKRKAGFR